MGEVEGKKMEAEEPPSVDRFMNTFKLFRSLKYNGEEPIATSQSDHVTSSSNWKKGDCHEHLKNSFPQQVELLDFGNKSGFDHEYEMRFGLKPLRNWKLYRFKFPQGLIYIENPFTPEGQRYWISKCVLDYPRFPHATNIRNLETRFPLNSEMRKHSEIFEELGRPGHEAERRDFYKKLRWVTFGYHHDWDTKVYSEGRRCDFPIDLAELTKYLAVLLGFEDFEPEAAIVNYYHLDSRLSGHQDRSERNQEAPLFSISFGQPAIFLIGGERKDIEPISILLKSGDIVVMSGRSRLSYHGVPRVLKSTAFPWNEAQHFEDLHTSPPVMKKSNQAYFAFKCENNDSEYSALSKWDDFVAEYVSISRINLNVRQVLFPGEAYLP